MAKETIKYILIWLFIFVVGSLIVTAIVNPEYKKAITNTIKDTFSKDTLSVSSNSQVIEECPPGIISETVIVTERIPRGNSPLISKEWEDGTPMEPTIFTNVKMGAEEINCPIGGGEGQNINYRYCSPIDYKSTSKNIDDNGNIISIDNIYYRINLTLLDKKIEIEKVYNSVGDIVVDSGYSYGVIDAVCERIN